MRSTFLKFARSGAALALAMGFCTAVTACDSCNPCEPVCAPKPSCAPPVQACAPVCPEPACLPQSGCGAFPAEARPGEAWCCVYLPPEYKTETYQVCTRPESCTQECIPAVMGQRPIQVCTQPACSRTEVIPCVMGTRPRQVCTVPASQRCETIPAVYATQEECIEICPSRTEWQRVDCPSGGEQREGCYALVTIPPTFEKRTKSICTQPEQTRTIDIPAVYATEHESYVVTPEQVREIPIPAVYATQMETYEVSPASTRTIPIPAEYKTESKQLCTREGSWMWKRNETCAVPMPAMPNPSNPCGANLAPMPK